LAPVVALTSLAFFTFFLFLVWSIVIGVWLLISARGAASSSKKLSGRSFRNANQTVTRRPSGDMHRIDGGPYLP